MNDQKRKRSATKQSQFAIIRALLFFFVFLGLEIVLDNRHEISFETASCEATHADETPWLYEHIYPWLLNEVLGNASSGKVAIVYIPEGLSEVQQNVCRGRAYLAALIDLLVTKGPSAIVLDKFFSTATCNFTGEEKEESALLRGAVKRALTSGIPVVVGEATGAAGPEITGTCLMQKPEYRFFEEMCADHYGLTALNANREQIPLTWRVAEPSPADHVSSQPTPKIRLFNSLALATTKLIDPEQVDSPRFQNVLHQARQPYARLNVPFDDVVSSPHLICPGVSVCDSPSQVHQSHATFFAYGDLPFSIRNRVVLIGSQSSSDRWLILGKRRWGFELQASYLDALLSGKYLSAVPGTWIVGLSIAFLFFLEAVPAIGDFLQYEHGKRIPSVVRQAGVWLCIWALLFLFVVFSACYLLQYLPPLSLVLGVFLTVAVRATFIGLEYFQKLSMPDREEP